MNRRSFVLSWGRKIFFGISWPLSILIGLLYLKSFVLPQTATDWLYYVTTLIGHYGLANALVYFLIYCPIVLMLPTYYVSRFWSLILILALNLFILLDGVAFSSYQLHVYSFLSKLMLSEGAQNLVGPNGAMFGAIGLIVLAVVIWLRGERVWRYMQTRFSNPVKNWYLVLIVLCLAVGKSIYHYGSIDPRLSSLFPLDFNPKRDNETKVVDTRTLHYPTSKLACTGKSNPNFVMIVIKEWAQDQLNPELMPNVSHMKKHGVNFNAHYAVTSDADSGIFSLYYSIPSSYQTTARDVRPAMMTELDRRQYEIIDLGNDATATSSPSEHDEKTLQSFKDWANNRSSDMIQSYSLNLTFVQHPGEVDKLIQSVVLELQKEGLLKDTYIVMTGGFAGPNNLMMPLLVFNPDRKGDEIDHATSHYDIVPTLMDLALGCKKVYHSVGLGKSLYDEGRDWLLISGHDSFKILDFSNSVLTTVTSGDITDTSLKGDEAKPRHELIFKALKINNKYTKPN